VDIYSSTAMMRAEPRIPEVRSTSIEGSNLRRVRRTSIPMQLAIGSALSGNGKGPWGSRL
jgi:hypothetical protein